MARQDFACLTAPEPGTFTATPTGRSFKERIWWAGRCRDRSWVAWRLSQNSGDVLNDFASNHAVSGDTPRFPLTISFTR